MTVTASTATAECCEPGSKDVLGAVEASRLAGLLRAVADPTRLRLLSMVAGALDGEACICHLTGPVGLSQPTVSHHMKILVDVGLLTREQRGRWAYYRLVEDAVATLVDDLLAAVRPASEDPAL